MHTALDVARPELREFRVDGWLVQPELNLLVRGERSIRVRPQLIDVMACLAVRPGAVVTKDQMLAVVWSDRHVCVTGIARCVAELRRILSDDARRPRIIETISKRGYRLMAPVEHIVVVTTPAFVHNARELSDGPDRERRQPVTESSPLPS
jgi:DNA-binding winged helix-turn-helix (wHTH) protein